MPLTQEKPRLLWTSITKTNIPQVPFAGKSKIPFCLFLSMSFVCFLVFKCVLGCCLKISHLSNWKSCSPSASHSSSLHRSIHKVFYKHYLAMQQRNKTTHRQVKVNSNSSQHISIWGTLPQACTSLKQDSFPPPQGTGSFRLCLPENDYIAIFQVTILSLGLNPCDSFKWAWKQVPHCINI